QRDASVARRQAGVEEGGYARQHPPPGVRLVGAGLSHRLDHLRLDLLEDGAEQVLLAGEVVVEGALGQPGGAGDVVQGCLHEAALDEGRGRRVEESTPGGFRVLRPPGLRHRIYGRFHTCSLQTTGRMRRDSMDVREFAASRLFADTAPGRIAYVERGEGPVALFLHGAFM